MNSLILRSALLAGTSFVLAVPAQAQDAPPPPVQPAITAQAPQTDAEEPVDEEEIVVVGQRPRGSVVGDIPPANTLTARDVRATGATDITELLAALAPQLGSAQGRGGERPILLLNGKRISGFREIRDIPTEAISRVEILPEEVALKYGYRADQKVVNIVLRERFRSTAVRAEARTATEGGYLGGIGDVTRLMIGKDSRTSVNLHAEANGALTESERDIALQASDVGTVIDARDARTLIGSRRLLRGAVTHNRTVLGDVSATINGELEHSNGQSLLGFPVLADGSAILDPRARNSASDSAHAGAALNWEKGTWRWSATGNADLARDVSRTDPDGPAIAFGRDRSRSTRTSGDADLTANGPLFKLPAGDASATFKIGASALHLDSSRLRAGVATDKPLGRTEGDASISVDLPISRRNRGFSALGNLTLNGNAGIEQLSDFGTLTTLGAGLNWSPIVGMSLIGSWTREEGAPSVQQLGDPLLETSGSRIFDFSRGETVLATAVTGGNPDLIADRRTVMKLGANWQPSEKIDLRLRTEFVRSRLDRPISDFPGVSAALEDAFPGRFQRASCTPQPCTGQLVRVDLRPVNFDQARRDTLRFGFDFTKPLKSARPSQAAIDQFRARRVAAVGVPPEGGPPPEGGGDRGDRGGFGGGGRGGGGGGGFGGGRQGGRLTFSLTDTVTFKDEVTIRPGLPNLDFLHGDALGSTGGRARHLVEAQAGYFNNGLGARASANWRSGTTVDSAAAGNLHFSSLATFDLQLFANLGERFDLVAKHPWLRGTQFRIQATNLFDAKPNVRDAAGVVPTSYQPDLLDPLGRTIAISFRKLFSPPPGSFRRQASPTPGS